MHLLDRGEFHVLEGVLSDLELVGDAAVFTIAGQRVQLAATSSNPTVRTGEPVRALVQRMSNAPTACVVGLQKAGSECVWDTAPRPPVYPAVLATSLLAVAYLAGTAYLIVVAIALALLQAIFVGRYLHMRAQVDAFALASRSRPLSVTATGADVPLSLPAQAPTSATQWPSEILEFTHDAIIIWEMDGGGVVYWNRAAEQLYGIPRAQAHGKVTHDLLQTRLAEGVHELESKLARYGVWIGELRHTRSDGRVVEVEARLSLMPQQGRPWLVLEVNRDVTDRNRAEAARLEMQLQLRRMRGQSYERD